ncbi:MAG: DUF1178 family protein [Aestuariivirga sp.]
MIRYDLVCDKSHEFDGWFRDSAAYDAQAGRGLLACPVCDSSKVGKQLMSPGVPVKSNRKTESTQKMMAGPIDPRVQMMIGMVREMRRSIEANAEYVGDKFTEEARRIHYSETIRRGIYGEASTADAKALIEEGIDVHPLPRLPEDGN